MMARWKEKQRREDRRFALVACVIANCFRDPKSSALKIEDFMPSYEAEAPKRRMSDKEMLEMVKLANAALGGVVR